MSVDVALINPKFPHNVGAAIRAMSCFSDGGRLMFTGDRVKPETMKRIPREERMKDYANIQWSKVEKPTLEVPDSIPIGVELVPGAQRLETFQHPKNALYIFGPEDGSIPGGVRSACHQFVVIGSRHCLNLAAAVYLLLYDKAYKDFLENGTPMPDIEGEHRGWATNPFDRE